MSYTFTVNQTPTNGAGAIFLLKENLKTAGWSILSSSDGTTYVQGSDQITLSGSGAGGMANTNAWFIIQSPDANYKRQFSFQRSTLNTSWRIKYSGVAGFTSGTVNATTTPSAVDQGFLCGAGLDGSPTYGILFPADGTYRFHTAAGGADENYPFYMLTSQAGTTTLRTALCLETMASGSFAAADPDPALTYVDYELTTNTFIFSLSLLGATSQISGITTPAGLFLNQYVNIKGHGIGTAFANGLVPNPHTKKDDYIPVVWGRPVSLGLPFGLKGVGIMMLWAGFKRSNYDTLSINSEKDRIFCNTVSLPWNGTDVII